jgi:outer membrane protein insertion porin family
MVSAKHRRERSAASWALLAVLWLACVSAPSSAAAQSVIRDIRIEGASRIEPETVRTYLKLAPGDTWDAAKADQSLKQLFATGLFADVRIEPRGSTVVVIVTENPIVNRVAFEGAHAVPRQTLESEVQLKPRSVFTRARAQADLARILDLYRRQGYFAAKVEPKVIELEQNRVDLVFEVTEGAVTKVASINFTGNRAFSDDQLRKVISTSQSGMLDFLKSNVVYDPDRLNLDRELLRLHYLKNGYADMRVVSATADLDREGKSFFVTFTLEEGVLYRFGAIAVQTSVQGIDTDALRNQVLTRTGEVFNGAQVEKSAEQMTLKLAALGQPFARVRPKIDRDAAQRVISVTFVVEEGPRLYVERIEIRGNIRTKDHVIRREFRVVEGDAYNALLIDRARSRLIALGFFKRVEVKREAGSAPDRVVLAVDVTEQETGELSFGVGYSSAEGVIGDIAYVERNLLGNGQYLKLKLSGSTSRLQADISFTEPRFMGTRVAAGFDLFHKEQDLTDTSSFKLRTSGGALRLGFPVAENWTGGVNYTLTRKQIYDVGDAASLAIKEAVGGPGKASNTYYTSSLGYSLVFDTRDKVRNPTRGIYVSTAQDLAGLGGDVRYIRSVAEARGYYAVTDGVTLAARAVGGSIGGWGGDNVRLLDLFYKGGESVRGFQPAGYGPRDQLSANRDALGGRNFYTTTAEVRFGLPYVPEELGLRGALFADAGSLWGLSKAAGVVPGATGGAHAVRVSAGAGLIWDSPLGPLRADYAIPLLKQPFDKTRPFSFGQGGMF